MNGSHGRVQLVSYARDELAERRHLLRLNELELRFLELLVPSLELVKVGESPIRDGNGVREFDQGAKVVLRRFVRGIATDEDRTM